MGKLTEQERINLKIKKCASLKMSSGTDSTNFQIRVVYQYENNNPTL